MAEDQIAYISEELDLKDAWIQLTNSYEANKTATYIKNKKLAPICRFWKNMGDIMKHSTSVTAVGSLLCATKLIDEPDLVAPLALSSMAINGFYWSFWKSNVFYKYFPVAETISGFMKNCRISRPCDRAYVLDHRKDRSYLNTETLLTSVALFVAYSETNPVKFVADKVKDFLDEWKDKEETEVKPEQTGFIHDVINAFHNSDG